ncbi:MAG: hypothetical protein H0X24_14955 [Ktedonobacterales bacterium]|nr:hypothetical protein [Ktedonobacterales bacterium]
MDTRTLLDFVPLGGSSRRYRVRATGDIISYRQFIKRTLHCTPEHRAAERKAAGLTAPRRARKDKGQIRCPPLTTLAYDKGRLTPLTIPVQVQHYPQRGVHEVLYQGRVIGSYYTRGHGARAWRCLVCRCALRQETSIIHHLYNTHRIEHVTVPILQSAGRPVGGGRVLFTGDVRSRSRKSRMPWPVHSDDPRYK